MLIWGTQFPVLPNKGIEDLILASKQWLTNSPHYGWDNNDFSKFQNNDYFSIKKESQLCSIAKILHNGNEYAGFRHEHTDEDGQEWCIEICGCHSGNKFKVGIFLYCSRVHGSPEPLKAHKPHIVSDILKKIGGDLDGIKKVSEKPLILSECDIDIAKGIINGTSKHELPIIYASATLQNKRAIDINKLAIWASGMAHVIGEPSRNFSFKLASSCGYKNPYDGAVAVYWPNSETKHIKILPTQYSSSDKLAAVLVRFIQKAVTFKKPDIDCTWAFIKEIALNKQVLEAKQAGADSLNRFSENFDQENRELQRKLDEANEEIRRLKSKQLWSEGITGRTSDSVITPCGERELYNGEIKDIIINSLLLQKRHAQEGGRVNHVISAILDTNKSTNEGSIIEDNIKNVFRSVSNLGAKEKRSLEDLGFQITEEGKHLKLCFRNDDRYTFSIPKTSSDYRAMLNCSSDIQKRLFR